jgi:hypothetical protein
VLGFLLLTVSQASTLRVRLHPKVLPSRSKPTEFTGNPAQRSRPSSSFSQLYTPSDQSTGLIIPSSAQLRLENLKTWPILQ